MHFDGLNESTIRGWFTADGQTLKAHPHVVVNALRKGNLANGIIHLGAKSVWEYHENIELEFIDWML